MLYIKKYLPWVKILIVLAGLYLFSLVTSLYLPIILAIVIAFILNPLVNYFSRIFIRSKLQMPRSIAVFLSFIFTGLIMVLLLSFVFLPFIKEFNKFVFDLPSLILKFQNISTVIEQKANTVVLPENIRILAEQSLSDVTAYSVDFLKRALNATLSFASGVLELVVVPVLTYYFLKDWQQLKKGMIEPFSTEIREKLCAVIDEIGTVISGYIRGQVLISFVMGFMVFLGMYVMGVDYPLVLGLMAALTETIPIIGPIIGAVPALLLAYLISPALAVKVLIFYLIVHQLENHIIVPNIMGHTIALHPVVIIISLLIGGQLMGIIGMMLAVPAAAILKVVLKHLWYQGER
jgi:predicted PurR-regulated permease PerM